MKNPAIPDTLVGMAFRDEGQSALDPLTSTLHLNPHGSRARVSAESKRSP
jgi:hypothetical protein